ncbi:MAG: ATP-binding protein [Candidatus Kapaibacterium sp.]
MWSEIIGQERAQRLLAQSMRDGRVAHAYCLWGPEAVAAEALAIAFARAVNCRTPTVTDSAVVPCMECRSCRQMQNLQHPNLHLVFALPTGKSGSSDDSPASRLSEDQLAMVQEEIARKAENPYHRILLEGATTIRIGTIRDIKKSVQLSQSQEGRRVFILFQAELMTMEAANALLKTLEEPQDNITLILCTERKELLPQTILSRCQQVQLEPLSDDIIAQALERSYHVDAPSARITASLAHGSIRRALDIRESNLLATRDEIVHLLRTALKGGAYRIELLNAIDELVGGSDRATARTVLSLLLVWLRDAYALHAGAEESVIVNRDMLPTLTKFAQAYGSRDLPAALVALEDTMRALQGNAHVHVSMLTAMLTLRRIFLQSAAPSS